MTSRRRRNNSMAPTIMSPTPREVSDNLPPPRRSQPLKSVSPPLSSTPLSRLIYILAFLSTLLLSFYCYRIVQYKTQVGGWWNLALGKSPQAMHGAQGIYAATQSSGSPHSAEHIIQNRINALAEALGVPSKELASAIAVAVRQHVPPASLSSIAARETGPAVEALLSDESEDDDVPEGDESVVDQVVHGMENFVGMDEPYV